jgi:hypothetical protein
VLEFLACWGKIPKPLHSETLRLSGNRKPMASSRFAPQNNYFKRGVIILSIFRQTLLVFLHLPELYLFQLFMVIIPML